MQHSSRARFTKRLLEGLVLRPCVFELDREECQERMTRCERVTGWLKPGGCMRCCDDDDDE